MSKYAEDFIKNKYEELKKRKSEEYTRIVVRLEAEYYLMLKELSSNFDFSVPTTFTDLINDNLFDMVASLNESDLKEFEDAFSKKHGGALEELRNEGIIKDYDTSDWNL
ncbi:TPA: hypothetical protein NKP47_004630 [Vibrio parahaemolyticus]|uniref:hypothetical protein n=1 Tax=Vibrio TaxID=662 RepID=UPI001CDC9EC6|nr:MULTISPECIES: hypothetical protein [Vibrio]MCA2494072.1 hypothetical protein [Vibrio alginolyticus]MDW2221228.1 hypothetical protein [Vibrio sp. 2175-1]HCH1012857.1 hypothetical protein [Vibrio parahaemolyticus]